MSTIHVRYRLLISCIILAIFAPLGGTVIHAANMPKGPYLIYSGNSTEMQVLWQLDETQTCTLEWGQDTNYNDGSVQTTEFNGGHQHKRVIGGLNEGVRYYYRVTDGDSQTYTGSFTAAPSVGASSVKFLAFGDTHVNPSIMDQVCAGMVATYTADPAFQTFCLHSGDWNDSDSEEGWAGEFFSADALNAREFRANVPINGCRGNHEGAGTNYNKYYPYPYVSTFYRSFDYGPVHVAIVDQYVSCSSGSAQYNWLQNDLATSSKPWKIVVYHEPAWSAGGNYNSTARTHLQPLFETYGVDMAVSGHNHFYSHSEVNGVQHITTGGGGAPLHNGNATAAYVLAYNKSNHHCEIDIRGNQLHFTAVNKNGEVIDTFTLVGENPDAPSVDAGISMITWSGQAVQLDPNIVNNSDPFAALTYLWSADPNDGVDFSATDIEDPTVTITKAADNPSVVTLTLAVNNVGRVEPPVEDTMTIDVYDDACKAAIGAGLGTDNPGDFDGNCITGFEDLAVMATKWLNNSGLTESVLK
jgi:predicted phosphodiesterase